MTFRKATYRAAQKVAPIIEEHFKRYIIPSEKVGDPMAPLPKSIEVESLLDTAFWASLRREEGYVPRISLALLPPEIAGDPMLFSHRQRLSTEMLTKISAGVERPGIHLGVWYEEENLYVWGTTREIPDNCFVLDVSEPGLLVIKHRRHHGFGKFANVAVLIGDQVKVVDQDTVLSPDCPDLVLSLLGVSSTYDYSLNVLIQLAVSMRSHGRGGTLLIVPKDKTRWKKSIVKPIKYAMDPFYQGLSMLMDQDIEKRGKTSWRGKVSTQVEAIAGYTAIDGATVINDNFELLAFGVKIIMSDSNHVEHMAYHEPVKGTKSEIINPSQNGGTRHLSAAQFVYDQRDVTALVASQDGKFTVFSWSPSEEIVQAYRIDSLLL